MGWSFLQLVASFPAPAQQMLTPKDPTYSKAGPQGDGGAVTSSNAGPLAAVFKTSGRATPDGQTGSAVETFSDASATFGVKPLKGYGDMLHDGPFRVYATALNCEEYTYAFGCCHERSLM